MTVLPLNPTRGESYLLRSLGFKFSPWYRFGYIISPPFPWSTNTLFTSYPLMQRVTTRASSRGWKVPILSSLEKTKVGCIFVLPLLDSQTCSSRSGLDAMDMILEEGPTSQLRVAKMTLIVPNDGRETAFLWYPYLDWLPYLEGWCMNYFNFPALTNYSKWSRRVL